MKLKLESTYHYEESIEKYIWRSACIGVIRQFYPKGIPAGQFLVTLGGLYINKNGNLIMGSEIDQLLRSGFVKAEQIVSVDCDPKVVARNDMGKLGVRNVYLPLTHKLGEKDCQVKWGEPGGIEKMVKDMVAAGETIAVVNADLMATHVKLHSAVANIMEHLSKQKANALLFANLSSLVRVGETAGKGDVLENLKGHDDFNAQFRKGKFNPCCWTPVPMTINGKHTFEYVSDHTPMQTVFLSKTTNPDFKVGSMRIGVKLSNNKDKNPVMVEAGRKAYETRLRNKALAAK